MTVVVLSSVRPLVPWPELLNRDAHSLEVVTQQHVKQVILYNRASCQDYWVELHVFVTQELLKFQEEVAPTFSATSTIVVQSVQLVLVKCHWHLVQSVTVVFVSPQRVNLVQFWPLAFVLKSITHRIHSIVVLVLQLLSTVLILYLDQLHKLVLVELVPQPLAHQVSV